MKTFNEVFEAKEKSSNRQENLKTNKLYQLMDKQNSLKEKIEMYEKEYNNSILNLEADTFKFYFGLQVAEKELESCKDLIKILFPNEYSENINSYKYNLLLEEKKKGKFNDIDVLKEKYFKNDNLPQPLNIKNTIFALTAGEILLLDSELNYDVVGYSTMVIINQVFNKVIDDMDLDKIFKNVIRIIDEFVEFVENYLQKNIHHRKYNTELEKILRPQFCEKFILE